MVTCPARACAIARAPVRARAIAALLFHYLQYLVTSTITSQTNYNYSQDIWILFFVQIGNSIPKSL